METWCIDFENEELGISVDAKTKEQAAQIAEKDETFRIHRLSDNVNY